MDGWMDWKSPGGGMYRTPYGANEIENVKQIIDDLQPGSSLFNIEHSNEGLITFPGGVPLITNGELIQHFHQYWSWVVPFKILKFLPILVHVGLMPNFQTLPNIDPGWS